MEMSNSKIYEDIAMRTDGDIYLGVVGPVRTGKSTFIKRFMETLVIPNIDNVYMKERARDELPQSGSGRTIMTSEPKFIPEDAVEVSLEDGVSFSVRLIDCVGYMVKSAVGQFEDESERMVTTPWFDHEISLTEAAETGTYKVIAEHSTIGLVVTTDGTVCGIPREEYIEAEERVVSELKAIGKPFVILLNSAHPISAKPLSEQLSEKYGVACLPVNCLELEEEGIAEILRAVLYEFPVSELGVFLPSWVEALPLEHEIQSTLYSALRSSTEELMRIKDIFSVVEKLGKCEQISDARVKSLDLGAGKSAVCLELPRELYYETISAQSGYEIRNDGDLMQLLTEMAGRRAEYDRVAEALKEVREKGYGIVMPTKEELHMEEPEIVRQGGRYGVRLKASAPSIHMIRANIETEVSPAIGSGGGSSEEIINFLLQSFDGDASRIWESNIFGKSLLDIAGESLAGKIKKMPQEAQNKLRDTLQRIVNEGSGGLICIIL